MSPCGELWVMHARHRASQEAALCLARQGSGLHHPALTVRTHVMRATSFIS